MAIDMDSNQFQAGLRILAVDGDNTVLESIEKMCVRYKHHVTPCRDALSAWNLVQERKGCFDVILIDVHVPNMDGFELLRRVKHEINVPVIMMSVDEATNAVMKSIKYDACDYWVKPLRQDYIKCMWRHVARKVWRENKLHESFLHLEEDNREKSRSNESEFNFGAIEAVVNERKNASRYVEADESKNLYGATKRRVVWTAELHQKFVDAVTKLGNEKAMPKRILEVMKEPQLNRQNVASHLQKYRSYMKKSDGEKSHQQEEKALDNTINTVSGDMKPELRGPFRQLPIPKQYYQQPPLVHHQIHSLESLVLSGNRAASDTQALQPLQSNNSVLLCNNLMRHGVMRSFDTVFLPSGIQYSCDPRLAHSIHHSSNDTLGPTISTLDEEEEAMNTDNKRKKGSSSLNTPQ